MFRHQVIFAVSISMLFLTFVHAGTVPVPSENHNIGTTQTPLDFKNMMSILIQNVVKHTMLNSNGPLSAVGAINKVIARAKKSHNEVCETYKEMLKKKENFEELQIKVNQMSSVKADKEIKQKLNEVQATASKGFQKLKEIENMKENVQQAIHESEIEDTKFIAHMNKTFVTMNSLLLGKTPDLMNNMFSMSAMIGDALSKFSSANTYSDRLLDMLEKLKTSSDEAEKNINDALKELQEIETTQRSISEMKQPRVLGVKDAQGSIMKDSTSVPSLLTNFACYAGVMILTVISTNYL